MSTELRPILYAEDDENDAYFLKRAFSQAGLSHPLHVVRDGQEAIEYCAGTARFANRLEYPVPCLVLLDLNMPRKSGIDVLNWIRKESALATLPVIILTSSHHDADIVRCYAQGANAYLVKPSQPKDLVDVAKTLKEFWLTHNRTIAPPSETAEDD